MKEKNQKTPTEQKKSLKKAKAITFGGEFVSVIMPFVIIGIVRYQDYFVEYDGTKMSIACVCALALMGLATWLVASKKFTNSFVTLIVGWATVTFIFFMLGRIINDIAYIMLFGLIGLCGAAGLDIANTKITNKINKIDSAIEEAQKEITKEQYKEEVKIAEEKKTVKVKIKKK